MALNFMTHQRMTVWLSLAIVVLAHSQSFALAQESTAGVQSSSRGTQYIDGKKFATGPSPWSGSASMHLFAQRD